MGDPKSSQLRALKLQMQNLCIFTEYSDDDDSSLLKHLESFFGMLAYTRAYLVELLY